MIKTFITGNLTRNPELKTVKDDKKVCEFTVASNRVVKDAGADFLPVEVWGVVAENCAKYLKKGSKVAVNGTLRIEEYEKDGVKHRAVKLVDVDVEFLDRAEKSGKEAK